MRCATLPIGTGAIGQRIESAILQFEFNLLVVAVEKVEFDTPQQVLMGIGIGVGSVHGLSWGRCSNHQACAVRMTN